MISRSSRSSWPGSSAADTVSSCAAESPWRSVQRPEAVGYCVRYSTSSASLSLATTRWNEILRLATALVVVLIGLRLAFGSGSQMQWLKGPERIGARIWRSVFPIAQKCLPRAPLLRSFVVGLFWGWLPCGLVYSALLAAAVAGSGTQGAAVLLAFGAGTVPAMLGIGLVGSRLPKPTGAFARLVGAVIVACGLWIAAMPLAALSNPHAHLHHHLGEAAPTSRSHAS